MCYQLHTVIFVNPHMTTTTISYWWQFIILFTSRQKHLRLEFFEMEFKRYSVIALHLAGKSQPAIARELSHLNVNKMFVYRTMDRWKDTVSIAKRGESGPKRTATAPGMVRKVKKRLEWNRRRSANQMAKELKKSERIIRRILKDEHKVKPYKFQKAHDLAPQQRESSPRKSKGVQGKWWSLRAKMNGSCIFDYFHTILSVESMKKELHTKKLWSFESVTLNLPNSAHMRFSCLLMFWLSWIFT